MVTNWYSSSAGNAKIRNCNFGICLYGTPNANRFHDIMLRGIRPVATHSESEDESFHPKLRPEIFPDGRVGAGVYVGGGTISGAHFDSVNTEMCGTAGYYFHSVPVSFTVTNMRSEAVVAPIWIQGPISPWYSDSVTFISPSIQCTSLVGPAVYLNRARGYTFINPRFYRLESDKSQVAIEMTAGSLGNYILNPVIIDPRQKAGAAVEPGAVRHPTEAQARRLCYDDPCRLARHGEAVWEARREAGPSPTPTPTPRRPSREAAEPRYLAISPVGV